MKQLIVLILGLFVAFSLHGQTTTLTQQQREALQAALTRIAMADAIVPNLVYNGTTFNEIQNIFNKQQLSIQVRAFNDVTR